MERGVGFAPVRCHQHASGVGPPDLHVAAREERVQHKNRGCTGCLGGNHATVHSGARTATLCRVSTIRTGWAGRSCCRTSVTTLDKTTCPASLSNASSLGCPHGPKRICESANRPGGNASWWARTRRLRRRFQRGRFQACSPHGRQTRRWPSRRLSRADDRDSRNVVDPVVVARLRIELDDLAAHAEPRDVAGAGQP